MAYPHDKQEHIFLSSTVGGLHQHSATASGDVGARWVCGFVPHVVRACAIIPTTSGGDYTSGQWIFKHINFASGSTASNIAVINAVPSDKSGHVIYKDGLNVVVNPGEAVQLNVANTATGADANFVAVMYIEPKWEQPTNRTANMRETT